MKILHILMFEVYFEILAVVSELELSKYSLLFFL